MELSKMLVLIGILVPMVLFNVVVDVGAVDVTNLPPCNFPAIFNFGDSNSAVGDRRYPINGAGHLLLQFMAEYLRVPYMNQYPKGPDFQHGANFAMSGASVKPQDKPWPVNLEAQVKEFAELKARTINDQADKTKASALPKPEDFSKALYTIDIAQNDFTIAYQNKLDPRPQIPDILNLYAAAVKYLYEQGARTFWLHNTAPMGCFGYAPKLAGSIPQTKDQKNCYTFMNEIASEYNTKLKETVNKLRSELPEAALTYVDIYTPMYELLTTYQKLGFGDLLGTVTFDGIHRTQGASQWIANWVVNGSVSDPPIPITHACHKIVGA